MTSVTDKAVAQLKVYGQYIIDHAENIIGDIDKPNYVTEDGIRIAFTLLSYDMVPTLEVTKEYIMFEDSFNYCDYESKMDALLCRLTNGKFSKTRTYDVDFMESVVNEEFESLYAEEHASSDAIAERNELLRDMYKSATGFNFGGWATYYERRLSELGIEVSQ